MLYSLMKFLFSVFFTVFFRADIRGRENIPKDGPVILAANHMSNFDPPFLACFLERPVCYMAKLELFEHPVFGLAIRACHAFPVKRGAADRGAIKAAIQVLKSGKVLGLFPEGTRSRTGRMGKAEAGIGLIAAMTGAPVVPACIIGTDRIGRFPKLRLLIGKPIHFEGNRKDKDMLAAFSQSVMTHVIALKEGAAFKK